MTSITNLSELEAWVGGDVGTIGANITILDNDTFPITLNNNTVLDGNGYTLTLNSLNIDGLFVMGGPNNNLTIKNIIIDAGSIATVNQDKGLIISSGHDQTGNNLLIFQCGVIGTFTLGLFGGTFVGHTQNIVDHTIKIFQSYSTATINRHAGGIVGKKAGHGGNLIIDECYSTGDVIGDNSGGIAGIGVKNVSITNCYSTGNVSGANSGGIIGSWCGIGTVANCYTTSDTGYISGNGTDKGMKFTNCFSQYATAVSVAGDFVLSMKSEHSLNATDCGFGNGSWTASLGTDLLDSYDGNTNVWITSGSFATGFGLTEFNEAPWDVDTSYTSNISLASFDTPGALGDPHITTLAGHKYDLQTNGFFRFFDNNNSADRLTINCACYKFPWKIWENMEYIRTVCVMLNDRMCIIGTGFRGEKVKIINNDGNFDIKETELPICKKSEVFCTVCIYKTTDDFRAKRHSNIFKHAMLDRIRNEIELRIDTNENIYTIKIMNVNYKNYAPCNVSFKVNNKTNISKYSGAVVRELNDNSYDVESLKDFSYKGYLMEPD